MDKNIYHRVHGEHGENYKNSVNSVVSVVKSVVYSRAAPKGAKSYLVLNVSIGGPAIGRALLLQTE